MTLQVNTLRYGSVPWFDHFTPTLEAWCKRHGYGLAVWSDKVSTSKGYPSPKFVERDMLECFLNTSDSRLLYVDADVWIHPEAPDFPALPGIAVATDSHHVMHNNHFNGWCAAAYGVEFPLWEYSNAGVWSIDREAAEKLLRAWVPPYREFFQDQHFFNAAICRAKGITVSRLPSIWNRWSEDKQPAWFQHFWGEIDKVPNPELLLKLKPLNE